MRKRFDEQLNELGKEMQKMGMMVEESIQKAIEALLRQDVELAKAVMEGDVLVDQKQKEIESICFTLLMQQQPVASDLRTISAALKMVTDMERIGDHASDISEMTVHLAHEPYIKNLDHIRQMATETMWMLTQSIEAYVEKDVKKATDVIGHDDIVDLLFAETKTDLIELIHKDKNNGEQATDLLMVAKYFERIGDHATNLAEWVIFSIDKRPRG